jgi:hypothetical protein
MKNHFIISESEKERILSSHKSFMPKRYLVETSNLSFTDQFTFFQNELEFLKEVHLHRISMLEGINKNIYLRTVQNDYALGIFENNSNILERFGNQFLDILNESITDFANELDKLNSFIIESLKISLVEQSDYAMDRRANALAYSIGARSEKEYEMVDRINTKAQQQGVVDLANAVKHIKEKGLGYVMETIREALFSGVGTAIQIALSFTGAGSVAVTIVWGVLGLYDLYQLTVNGNTGYLGNFIIDLICCVTAGYLAKPLAGFAGKMFSKVDDLMAAIMKSSAGPYVTKVMGAIESGFQSVMGFFKEAATFMKNKMGINWVSNLISKLEPYYTKIVNFIKSLRLPGRTRLATMQARSGLAKISSLLAPSVIRTSAALSKKFSPEVFAKVALLTPIEIGTYIGVQLEKTALAAINKESKSRFKEQPTENFLRWVDDAYGTAYGDIYLAYLNGKKMFNYNNKGKFVQVPELGANAIRGEFDYIGVKAADVKKGTAGVVKKAGI